MIAAIHRIGSWIRAIPFLERQQWLWDRVEPVWQRAFDILTRHQGYPAHVADDVFRLDYEIGARYDRHTVRAYEPMVYQAFVGEIEPGMVVCDAGAHFGFFTLGAAKRVGDAGKVFAFEPTPETLKVLKRHVRFNGWDDRVEVIPAVVSDRDGQDLFYVHGVSMSNSMARENVDDLSPQIFDALADEIAVPSVTLDAFCEQRRVGVDVIKIDVEGAELKVLKGARRILERGRTKVFCEIHPRQMENCGGSLEELRCYLAELSYEIVPLDEPNWMEIFHGRLVRRAPVD